MQIPLADLEGIVARMQDEDWHKLPKGRLERDLFDTYSHAATMEKVEAERDAKRSRGDKAS